MRLVSEGMKKIFLLIMGFGLVDCSQTTDKTGVDTLLTTHLDSVELAEFHYESLYELGSYVVLEAVDTAELQTINFDCAFLVYPTEEQIEQIKKDEGEENFYTIADDYNWYQSLAIEVLDSAGIRQEDATRRYVTFKGDQKSWTLDLRKANLPAWNMVLFKTNKEPIVVPAIDLTKESVREYFETAE